MEITSTSQVFSEATTQVFEANDQAQTTDSSSFNTSELSQFALPERLDDVVRTLGLIFGIPVLFLCVAGNTFVLLVTIKTRHFRSSSHIYFASLSVLDLIYGLAFHPMRLAIYYQGKWMFGPEGCAYSYVFYNWHCASSLSHILVITLTRYSAVVRQRIKCPTDSISKSTFLAAGALFALPAVLVLLSVPALWQGLAAFDKTMVFYLPRMTCRFRKSIDTGHSKVFLPLLVCILAVTGIILFCHIHILVIVRKSHSRVCEIITGNQKQTSFPKAHSRSPTHLILLRREKNITKTVILVMINFSVGLLINPILVNVDGNFSWSQISFFPGILLQTLPPATNWIIYGLGMAQYRHFYSKICGLRP